MFSNETRKYLIDFNWKPFATLIRRRDRDVNRFTQFDTDAVVVFVRRRLNNLKQFKFIKLNSLENLI